jgi:predicted DsbA family dithiol-disulfide isomerase
MAGDGSGRTGEDVVVDIWSDVMCSFCYMGSAALDLALEQFPHRDRVQVRHHSFMLMPELAADAQLSFDDLLVTRHGLPRSRAHSINAQVAARAELVGLDYRMDAAIVTNTRTAHRLTHHAATRGVEREMLRRLFKAYFTDGLDVGDHHVLADLAQEVGLDRDEVLKVLGGNSFQASVDADLRHAAALGITGVPFLVFDGKYAVSGAQPVEYLSRVLDTTWDEAHTSSGSLVP